jgi:hypothetical protein
MYANPFSDSLGNHGYIYIYLSLFNLLRTTIENLMNHVITTGYLVPFLENRPTTDLLSSSFKIV